LALTNEGGGIVHKQPHKKIFKRTITEEMQSRSRDTDESIVSEVDSVDSKNNRNGDRQPDSTKANKMISNEESKNDVGMDDSIVPVNIKKLNGTFDKLKFAKEITAYATEIRMNHYVEQDGDKPFDEDDKKGLGDSHHMLGVVARIPLLIALVSLKYREEGLWRNQGYKDCFECLCALLNLKEGAIRRYLIAGLVIALLIKERGIVDLPVKISPYLPFAELQFPDLILSAYDKAKEISDDGVVTEKIARKVVSGYERIGKPSRKDTEKSAVKAKKQSQESSASEPEAPKWEIKKSSKAIVAHVETVLNPVIVDYLGKGKRSEENIAHIVESLKATLKLLMDSLKAKSGKEV
jgi:hypothetical protein